MTYEDGTRVLLSAIDGTMLSPVDEALIVKSAKRDFALEYDDLKSQLLINPPREFGRKGPVWQVQFDDTYNTRLYISPTTAEVITRRNDLWRLFDFFWMLHIMDYDERENFNTWWLATFAGAGLIFAFSGFCLVIFRLRAGRYKNDIRLMTKRK